MQMPSSFVTICEESDLSASSVKIIAVTAAVAIINIAISLFGTLANGLVIMAYYRNPRLRTIQNMFFFLLAITDFIVTAFAEPMYVTSILSASLGKPRCVLWDVNTVLSVLLVDLSLVTIVILSLQSYLTLAYPYHYQTIITKSRLIITLVVSFVVTSSLTFAAFGHEYLNTYRAPVMILAAITTVFFTWCWTYKLVARHRKAIQTTQTPSNSENISRKKILRSTITALVIVATLSMCYLLVFCLFLSEIFLDPATLSRETHVTMWLIAVTLMYLNSFLNPCLVFWRSSSFRQTVENIFLSTKIRIAAF